MKRKFGTWVATEVGKRYGPYGIWSDLVPVAGSELYERLAKQFLKRSWSGSWRNQRNHWPDYVVLKPVGDPGTRFIVGFIAFFGDVCLCQVNVKYERSVSQGRFAMLRGPLPCLYFAISDGRRISLVPEEDKKGSYDLY